MFCSNCYTDVFKYEEYVMCMKCNSIFCLNCEQFGITDLFYIDNDKILYKKKCYDNIPCKNKN